jgi:hypothetical protein
LVDVSVGLFGIVCQLEKDAQAKSLVVGMKKGLQDVFSDPSKQISLSY